MKLLGNFETGTAQVLEIYFEKCNPNFRKTCKPDKDVKEWMKGKFLKFGYNKNIFEKHKFGANTFKKFS